MRIACLVVCALLQVAAAEAPATLTKVNLVATEVGGGIEEITGFVGPGFTGRRLLTAAPLQPGDSTGTAT